MPINRKRRNSDNSRLFGPEECAFCGSSSDDEVLYGKLVKFDFLTTHYNCLFLASGLSQQGDEVEDELYGFFRKDIEAELSRGKKLFCSYCRKRGATVGCCEVKCKKSFHLPCGIQHGALNQYFDTFSSFCKEHAPKQNVKTVPEDFTCQICYEDMEEDIVNSVLYSPCCKNGCFHKICLQKHALSAGCFFFKCPLCNNSKDFMKEMEFFGIRIPEKDASWELEGNAYQDLLAKPECGASSCLCPRGKDYCPRKKSGWTLLPCKMCGADARHKNCENLRASDNSWICSVCKTFEIEIQKKKVVLQEDAVAESVKRKIECSLSQDNKKFHSVPSTSQDLNTLSKIRDDTELSENIKKTPTSVDNKRASTKDKVLHSLVTKNKKKIDFCCENSDINLTEPIVNLKDLKNVPTCIVTLKRIVPIKPRTVKTTGKKTKFSTPCSSLNHVCIRKYFGKECCKFRI